MTALRSATQGEDAASRRSAESLAAEFEEIAVAPAEPDHHAEWLARAEEWRARARRALDSPEVAYAGESSRWASTAFVCGMVMLWDQEFYDRASGEFRVEEYLADADRAMGGYDVLVLWHAYPRIGFDERNQFDFYRDLPGGLPALRSIVERLHARGVRAILDYNPWDTATRREGVTDSVALAAILRETGADGLFLDTLTSANSELPTALETVRPGIVLQSELLVPLDRIRDHAMSWIQWPDRLDERLLLRNKWFEPRQMQHLVRRWDEDHRDELHVAWLNGAGIVFWENIFGSRYPWTSGDQEVLRLLRPVWERAGRFFSEGAWEPYVPMLSPSVRASRWTLDGASIWTVVNTSRVATVAGIPGVASSSGDSGPGSAAWFDLLTGDHLDPRRPEIALTGRGVGCVAAVDDSAGPGARRCIEELLEQLRRSPGHDRGPRPSQAATPSSASVAPRAPVILAPDGMASIAAGHRSLTSVFRLRECGTYVRADLVNSRAPDFSRDVLEQRQLTVGPIAVQTAPVTNAEFARFLDASGYRPRGEGHFLDHWVDGRPAAGAGDEPVTYVDLVDARAYAAWRGWRLPTEDEWQVALTESAARHGTVRVWEWTESEQSDGYNRFVIVKGGSTLLRDGSDWYAESGPKAPERSAKFILFHPGLDRCSTVGFRCAVDLPADHLP